MRQQKIAKLLANTIRDRYGKTYYNKVTAKKFQQLIEDVEEELSPTARQAQMMIAIDKVLKKRIRAKRIDKE